jgi:hypothetical protein
MATIIRPYRLTCISCLEDICTELSLGIPTYLQDMRPCNVMYNSVQILILRLGPAERHNTELCTLLLDKTVGSGFFTAVVFLYWEACIGYFLRVYTERRV